MPEEMIEIRWHARGGQGAKTAALLMAEVAMHEGKFSQGFPEYGPERAGAPIKGYTRISADAIYMHCPITEPTIVVVLDETLLETVDVTEGLVEDGTIIINTRKKPDEIRPMLGNVKGMKVCTVDATQIALDTIKLPIPNTPMLGVLVKVMPLIKMEGVYNGLEHKFAKKLSAEMMEGNRAAVKRAFEEVTIE
jgi:pyruvate ferredoxin oxidoreductase gamma subunit